MRRLDPNLARRLARGELLSSSHRQFPVVEKAWDRSLDRYERLRAVVTLRFSATIASRLRQRGQASLPHIVVHDEIPSPRLGRTRAHRCGAHARKPMRPKSILSRMLAFRPRKVSHSMRKLGTARSFCAMTSTSNAALGTSRNKDA